MKVYGDRVNSDRVVSPEWSLDRTYRGLCRSSESDRTISSGRRKVNLLVRSESAGGVVKQNVVRNVWS